MLNALGWVKPCSPWYELGPPMRAAAIDLGKVRVGLAVADELGVMAHPRPYLDGRNPKRLLEALSAVAAEDGIGLFIVGLPRALGGAEGAPARRARKFAAELAARTGRRVELVDEWLSTKRRAGACATRGSVNASYGGAWTARRPR